MINITGECKYVLNEMKESGLGKHDDEYDDTDDDEYDDNNDNDDEYDDDDDYSDDISDGDLDTGYIHFNDDYD